LLRWSPGLTAKGATVNRLLPSPCLPLLLALLLTACGGPSYRVRVLDTPGSGLKGTQKPYEVNGERYEPLPAAHGYVEEGVASWYGEEFHGRKTSNGEIYDMHAATAAHKTLPMNVYVRVTNRANGRQSVVRINDRGPFVRGRIIDLSYAAARELGVVGPGTAPVRIEALGYGDVSPTGTVVAYRQPESYELGPFSVQVGAFTVEQNARRLADELRRVYGDAAVVEGWVGPTRYHRVRVGRYPTIDQANAAAAEFAARGYHNSFVVASN
jgi:rare lipoprotein A